MDCRSVTGAAEHVGILVAVVLFLYASHATYPVEFSTSAEHLFADDTEPTGDIFSDTALVDTELPCRAVGLLALK